MGLLVEQVGVVFGRSSSRPWAANRRDSARTDSAPAWLATRVEHGGLTRQPSRIAVGGAESSAGCSPPEEGLGGNA